MNPTPSIVVAAAFALALTVAKPLRAERVSSPVNDLAKKLSSDPTERVRAGKRLEDFLLKPDPAGKSFVSADADHAALGALARKWAETAEPGRLAILLFIATPDSRDEARLRVLLSPWTGNAQIKKDAGKSATVAFLVDAGDKAAQLLNDTRTRREIDATVQANDSAAVEVPSAGKAIERARKLRKRRGSENTSVFGLDRTVPDLNNDPRTHRELEEAIRINAHITPETRPAAEKVQAALQQSRVQLPADFKKRKQASVPSPVDTEGLDAENRIFQMLWDDLPVEHKWDCVAMIRQINGVCAESGSRLNSSSGGRGGPNSALCAEMKSRCTELCRVPCGSIEQAHNFFLRNKKILDVPRPK